MVEEIFYINPELTRHTSSIHGLIREGMVAWLGFLGLEDPLLERLEHPHALCDKCKGR